MTTNLETSVYVQPDIDYDIDKDRSINIKMDYIEALNDGGLSGFFKTVASGVIDGTLGDGGGLVLEGLAGGYEVKIAVDQNNPLGASVSLVNTGTGLVIGGAVSLVFEIAGATKVLSNVNQIYQWVKDILKGNQNPAYLIQIDEFKKNEKKKQKIFKKYFENKGIYQINYSQIQEIVENFISIEPLNKNENTSKNKLSPIGQNLYKTLYFIKNYYDKNIANSDKITLLKTLNFVACAL